MIQCVCTLICKHVRVFAEIWLDKKKEKVFNITLLVNFSLKICCTLTRPQTQYWNWLILVLPKRSTNINPYRHLATHHIMLVSNFIKISNNAQNYKCFFPFGTFKFNKNVSCLFHQMLASVDTCSYCNRLMFFNFCNSKCIILIIRSKQ